jgi:hypothetical protein
VLAAQPQAGSLQQPHEASQQLSPQQSSPQQSSAQPQLDSQQQLFLANRRLRKQPFLHLQQLFEAQPHEASQQPSLQPHEASQQLSAPQQLSLPQQSSPQQSSGQPHEASQQPSLPQQSSPQQSSPQQSSAQPHEASQQLFLPNRRLRKQPFLHLQQLFEAQPHEASQQLSPQQSSPQQSSPQQSSGQPHEASQQPSLPQQSSPQQSSAQPQLLSQQDFFLNRFKRQQPFLHLQQSEAQPQEASQQSSPQQSSPQQSSQQGSSQQPHDFSQQHDGSALSQPQPLLSIRSSRPAPKLWLARQRLITSAPMTFFIEPPLLCVGVNSRDDLMRRRGSAAALPGIACRGDRGAAWGESRKSCSGRELSNRRGRRGTKAGGRDPFEPKGRRLASRANPWLDSVTSGGRRSN